MSRAFVDEDASDSGQTAVPELKIPIPPGSRNYLTPQGAQALSAELHLLTASDRPQLLSLLASDAGSEEVTLARRRLEETDRRIAYLYTMSSLAEVQSPPPPEGRDRVKFGAAVRVIDEDGRERSYRIVGVDEADPDSGLIGWPSPVARALMGKRVGEQALVKLPSGQESLTILALDYPG